MIQQQDNSKSHRSKNTTTNIDDSKEEKRRRREQEQQTEEEEITIIINDGYCMKENKVKGMYKIQHNIWYNRARRRWRKSEYFSERS